MEYLAEPRRALDLGPEGQEVGEAVEVAGGEDVVKAAALEEASEALEEALPARRGSGDERQGRERRDVGGRLWFTLAGGASRECPPRPMLKLLARVGELVRGGTEVLSLAGEEAVEGRGVRRRGSGRRSARRARCGYGRRRTVACAAAAAASVRRSTYGMTRRSRLRGGASRSGGGRSGVGRAAPRVLFDAGAAEGTAFTAEPGQVGRARVLACVRSRAQLQRVLGAIAAGRRLV